MFTLFDFVQLLIVSWIFVYIMSCRHCLHSKNELQHMMKTLPIAFGLDIIIYLLLLYYSPSSMALH